MARLGGDEFVLVLHGLDNRSEIDRFCARLLEQEKVAAVPGIAFGADDYIRISYATSDAVLEDACGRIRTFCESLT